MKKVISIIITLILVFCAFSFVGCGEDGGTGFNYPDYPQTPSDKDSWEYSDESVTIDWYVDTASFQYSDFGSDKISRIIKEKTGVNVNFTAPVDNDGQYLSNLISSGSLPDVVTVSAYTAVKDRMCTQGYVYPIDELAKRWAPTLINRIEKDIHAYYELSDGNIYGLPSHSYSEE